MVIELISSWLGLVPIKGLTVSKTIFKPDIMIKIATIIPKILSIGCQDVILNKINPIITAVVEIQSFKLSLELAMSASEWIAFAILR